MNKTIVFKRNKILNKGGRKFLYSIEDSGLYEIDDKIEQILALSGHTINELFIKLVKEKNMEVEEINNLLQMIYSAGLVLDSNSDETDSENMRLAALTLMVSQECNMKCAYCYGDGGEYNNKGKMTLETAQRAVDYLIENSHDTKLAIAFLGGEPLLNFELIKEVVKYCRVKEPETGRTFSYTITTNGTLLTPEIENYLISNQIKTQISIDGPKEEHDQMRYFNKKKPSYTVVVDKTKSMREKNLLTARATLSPKNLDYIKTFEHLVDLGFRAVPIEPEKNLLSKTDSEIELAEYIRYLEYFKTHVKQGDFDVVNKMTDFVKAMGKIENAGKREYGCGAFHRMYAVDIDGSLYPCHRFVGIPEFCVGSIYQAQGKETEQWCNVDDRYKCSVCWLKNLCGGGCAYENYVENGSINITSSDFCQHMELLYSTIIDIFIEKNYINAKP